ncbi:hypothetical protein QJS10_CPA01g01617 [Acorus calamus]|uniref:Uncharacterized protein n=1 Tax=Acorus calamus TaxID=4465 RepID=A0AAV9FM87_ACOCL|nr:hypothetical protein QJS10_CPA01g01617 [Acorus calamus]
MQRSSMETSHARRGSPNCSRSSASQMDSSHSTTSRSSDTIDHREVTAIVEKQRMKKMSGVKTREMLLWLTITDVYIEDPSSGKITFKTGTGLSESFCTTAFEA